MKNINLYIIEKLKINKDVQGIKVSLGDKDELFTKEEKERCVELSKDLPEQPIEIVDGIKRNAIVISNVVALRWPDSKDGMNFIGINKTKQYGFIVNVRSPRYKRDYQFPKKNEMLRPDKTKWLPTIDDVFEHIKEYFNKHKNWNK